MSDKPEFVYFLEIGLKSGLILDFAVTYWSWVKNATKTTFTWTNAHGRSNKLRHLDVDEIVSIVERLVVPYDDGIRMLENQYAVQLRPMPPLRSGA